MENRKSIAPAAPPVVLYALKESPPYLVYGHQEQVRFKVYMDGSTFYLWPGGIEIPAPGCPIPERLFWANFQLFCYRNRAGLFKIIVMVITLVAIQALLWTLPGNPMTDLHLSFVDLFFTTVSSIGVFLVGWTFLGWTISKIHPTLTWQVGVPEQETIALLEPGSLDFGPNTLICCLSEDEDPADFARRLEAAEKQQEAGEVILVIARGQPIGTIIFHKADDEEVNAAVFDRDNPPFQDSDWEDEDRIVPLGHRFHGEPWNDYLAYLEKSSEHWPEYLEILKAQEGNPVKNLTATLRRTSKKAKSKTLKKVTTK